MFQVRHIQIASASDPLFRPLHTQGTDQAFTCLFVGEDLYYRLNVFTIQVPPLRDRAGDVLFLARHFLADYARDLRKPPMGFSKEAEDWLQQQEFPGNVRMLENAVERAATLCEDGESDVDDLGFEPVERAPIVLLTPEIVDSLQLLDVDLAIQAFSLQSEDHETITGNKNTFETLMDNLAYVAVSLNYHK